MGGATANPRGLDTNLKARAQNREYDAIADRIARDRPGRVLDWGCGWGQMTKRLRDRGVETDAFDYRGDIEQDGRYSLQHFPEIEAYLSSEPVKLPFGDDTFDAVLSCGVLEHVQDPDASLEELRRVLRPGGALYVYKLPNRFSYLEKIARAMGLYYHGRMEFDRLYDLRSARAIMSRHGFEIVEARRMNMLPLTVTAPAVQKRASAVWDANLALSRVPGLNVLATNVELVARCTSG